MLSSTRLCDPVNGYRARQTVIGSVRVEEPFTHRIGYETASWYTLVEVPPGNYEIVLHEDGRLAWVLVRYHGTITDEHFVNRLFWSTSVAEPKHIGQQSRATVQLHPGSAARSFSADPNWDLAEDWSVEVEQGSATPTTSSFPRRGSATADPRILERRRVHDLWKRRPRWKAACPSRSLGKWSYHHGDLAFARRPHHAAAPQGGTMSTTEYALGTSLTYRGPESYLGYASGRAICEDGVVRLVRFTNGGQADTFFSVPGYVRVKGRYVPGFVSVESAAGFDTVTPDDPAVIRFTAYRYAKNADLIERRERVTA